MLSEVFLEELFDGFRRGVLIGTFDGDVNGIAAFYAHSHQCHELSEVNGLVALGDLTGALEGLYCLDQNAGGTRMDTYGIGDGVRKLLICS